MKVLVTGAAGGLGRALQRLEGEHEIIPLTRSELDVAEAPDVADAFEQIRPDLAIHAAAMTAVDACEGDPEGAYRANAAGSRNVAIACRHVGAVLVALSTDYVFDGQKDAPYHEFDPTAPLSVYGVSKLAGEWESRLAPEHVIVRTSWVFGGGSDFLTSCLRRLRSGERVSAIADLIGSPTYVGFLAERLIPLAESGARGVVHLGGGEALSWHDVLSAAVERFDLPGEVAPQKSEELARPAPRPRFSALTSLVLPEELAMPPVLDGVARVLEALDG